MYRPFPSRNHVYNRSYSNISWPKNTYHNGCRENNSKQFWCETCDRDFHSSQLLQNHIQQHEKCNIDGCQFIAHPKVITKHIQMQHSSGLYNKIAKLDNPQAIIKWREERKNKYPTKSNIERKAAEIQEKINRGEKMCLRKDKMIHPSQHNNISGSQGATHKNLKNHSKNRKNDCKIQHSKILKKKKHVLKMSKIVSVSESAKHKLKPFAGIQDLITNSDSEENITIPGCDYLTDDEVDEDCGTKDHDKLEKPAFCGALSNLICNYGSSDEETEKTVATINSEEIVNQTIHEKTKINKIKPNISDDDSGPDEVKNVQLVDNNSEPIKKNKATVKSKLLPATNQSLRKHVFNKSKPKLPSTLLQKLLVREIQHERNIVLQCIKHIIDNKYFDRMN